MIVEYIRYRIEPPRSSEFLSAYEVASPSLRESSHCFGYELSQCVEASEFYTLRILWGSAWRASCPERVVESRGMPLG